MVKLITPLQWIPDNASAEFASKYIYWRLIQALLWNRQSEWEQLVASRTLCETNKPRSNTELGVVINVIQVIELILIDFDWDEGTHQALPAIAHASSEPECYT